MVMHRPPLGERANPQAAATATGPTLAVSRASEKSDSPPSLRAPGPGWAIRGPHDLGESCRTDLSLSHRVGRGFFDFVFPCQASSPCRPWPAVLEAGSRRRL